MSAPTPEALAILDTMTTEQIGDYIERRRARFVTERAPVQASPHLPRGQAGRAAGSISWEEHTEAWQGYARRFSSEQSAKRIAERGGFSYRELCSFLGRAPTTWIEGDAIQRGRS